jgi:hypothetical protein
MSKTNWLLSAFIPSAMFLFACSSTTDCDCSDSKPNSSSSVYSSSSLGNTVQDQYLVRKNIKLTVDSSYADIDGEMAVYTEADAKNNLSKIDLIAYNDSIYRPRGIDLFWDPIYIGSEVFLFEIPDEQADIFKTAKKYSEIVSTLVILADSFKGTGLEKIPIVEGKVFFVSTSEDKYRVAIIKEAGNQFVNLEIIEIPGH